MKKTIFIFLFIVLGNFFAGCHTLNTLSKVYTGHIDFRDIHDAIVADDRDLQTSLW